MYEKILKIERFEEDRRAGYRITTDAQVILFYVDGDREPCDTNYLMSEDNPEDFLASYITEISVTDTALKTYPIATDKGIFSKNVSVFFVDIETTKGTLQLVAYQTEEPYYGCTVSIKSTQLNGNSWT